MTGVPDLELMRRLSAFNRERLTPRLPAAASPYDVEDELLMRDLEEAFVEGERRAVSAWAAQAPPEPGAFVAWFEALREHGPGQGDVLFPWLATEATLPELRWFLAQEVAG